VEGSLAADSRETGMAQAPADDLVLSIEAAVQDSGRPTCLLTWGDRRGHLTPGEVRALALSWLEAADAAENDATVLQVLEDLRVSAEIRQLLMAGLQERRALL
jgi:hypothetical protein